MRKDKDYTSHIPKESESEYLEELLKKVHGKILFPEKVERARNMLKNLGDASHSITK